MYCWMRPDWIGRRLRPDHLTTLPVPSPKNPLITGLSMTLRSVDPMPRSDPAEQMQDAVDHALVHPLRDEGLGKPDGRLDEE